MRVFLKLSFTKVFKMDKLLIALLKNEGEYYKVDADRKGFMYTFLAATGDWKTVGYGRKNEWNKQHFTLEEAVQCGFKAIGDGISEPTPDVIHGVAHFRQL